MSTAASGFSEAVSRITISSTIAVSMEADRMKSEGAPLSDFGAGEPDFDTPEHIKQAAIRAIEANFTRYTPAGGTSELRKAVGEWHRREFQSSYNSAETLITVGGKHAIFNTAEALLNAGDEVILPAPYWVSFKDIVQFAGARPVIVDTHETDGYELRPEAVEKAFTSRTRMVILNSPNNPSGAAMDPGVMERIAGFAAARGVWVLSDECYSDLVYGMTPYSLGHAAASDARIRDRLVICGSLSKTFAMTGWRCGFSLAPKELTAEMLKLQSHSTSNVTSITQKAAMAALTGPMDPVYRMRDEYQKRRDFVVERVNRIPGVVCPTPRGAFYVYPNIGEHLHRRNLTSTTLVTRLLREALVAVVPGEAFGTANHLRLSYAASLAELERGISRMHDFFANL